MESRQQAQVVERGWAKLLAEVPDLAQDLADLLPDLTDTERRAPRLDILQIAQHRHQGLGSVVVELAGDALALRFLRLADLPRIGPEIVLYALRFGYVTGDVLERRGSSVTSDQARADLNDNGAPVLRVTVRS